MNLYLRSFALAALVLLVSGALDADDPPQSQPGGSQVESTQAEQGQDAETTPQDRKTAVSDEASKILSPLFLSIKRAEVSRATIEMLSDTIVNGQTIDSKQATYQIASQAPDLFTIYYKDGLKGTRLFNGRETSWVALTSKAYVEIDKVKTNQDAVFELPVPLGPYSEPVLALSLAGVDPEASLARGMKSVAVVDETMFRKEIPAVHLHGIQLDHVEWDLWVTKEQPPKPIRMLIDLSPMLHASKDFRVPAGYSHQIRYDFKAWRVSGEVDPALFSFKPAKDAKQYDSIEQYQDAMDAADSLHPLLAQPLPKLKLTTLGDTKIDDDSLEDKVLVIDFWSASHPPCKSILSTINEVIQKFKDRGVELLTVNVGDSSEQIDIFLKDHQLDLMVVPDLDGKVIERFSVESIPFTLVVGRDGIVESIHEGFPGNEALEQRLTEELELLTIGGKIASAQAANAK